MKVIKEVKSKLSSNFDMKDLGDANFILGIEIKRDHAKRKLWLNKRKYVHIPIGVKLSVDQCPKTQEEEEDMSHVMYVNVVDNLMYAMVCTRSDIAHTVRVLRRYMSIRKQ